MRLSEILLDEKNALAATASGAAFAHGEKNDGVVA